MKTKDFFFDLPPELIAQRPVDRRGTSRLLVLERSTGTYFDSSMSDFPNLLAEGSVLVVNNSKVRKARVFGYSDTGAKVEFLFLNERQDHCWNALTTKSKRQHVGKQYRFISRSNAIWQATIVGEEETQKIVQFDRPIDESFFEECGHVPLPPYIKREDDFSDESRYQTVYARYAGSVAAPTAGLHFTDEMLKQISARGIALCQVTLHVGPGTFVPVRTQQIEEHPMHSEWYEISQESADLVTTAKREGRKVVAVGTTSVRTLESAYDAEHGILPATKGKTDLFITKASQFAVVDQLLTNFHMPESTLLVLVSAFAGKEAVMRSYHHAIEQHYRFFSYGDAMFIR